MANPPAIPTVPSTGKKRPQLPQTGIERDASGNPILDRYGNAIPIPTSSDPNHPYVLGLSDTGAANTEFKNYQYDLVPGTGNLFGTTVSSQTSRLQQFGKGAFKSLHETQAGMVFRGQDLKPDDAMARFASLDPTARASIEYQMWQGGFYGKGQKFVPGAPVSDADRGAFKKLLLNSIKTNQPADTLLSNTAAIAKASGINPGTTSSSNQIRPIVTASNATLDDALKTAFAAALGRSPTASEMDKFASTYHAAQIAKANASGFNDDGTPITADGSPVTAQAGAVNPYQVRDVSNAGIPATSDIAPVGVTVNPQIAAQANAIKNPIVQAVATPAQAATQYAQTTDPAGYASTQVGARFNDFANALIGSPANNISAPRI